MPDSSRPTSSRFFQISKSYLTFDNSAKRVTSHPGGKNLPTIFAYLTSKIFEIIVLTVNNHNKIGKLAFDKTDGNWQSPHSFLSHMEWSANQFTENIITDIFNSFVQDKVMKSRSDPKLEFSLIKDLEFPSDAQISEARLSNVYLMNIIDDLTKFLPQTLETGKPSHNRNTMLYAPLWEAYFADSIHDAYKDEMIIKTNEFITKMNFTEKLTFIQIGTGAGFGTIEIMELLLDKLRDIEIQVNYVEQISYLMGKARE
ncbi:MAG: hypothetical protein ACC656_12950, partial [Candidatus Heimdallarchaeota archaeon]